jgi:hypothetical protein
MLLWFTISNGSSEPDLKLHGKDPAMRSMKLLVALALVAALVAGPVLAQEAAPVAAAPAVEAPAKAKVAHAKKHHAAKKAHHVKKVAPAAAPATAQ